MEFFDNSDGWYDKYIENVGPVGYLTQGNRPRWQCSICKHLVRSHSIEEVRQHVFTKHKRPKKDDSVGLAIE